MGTLRRRCATVPQPSKLRFGVVRAPCGSPRHWWSTSCKGKGRFWGFLFPIFTKGNAIGSPTVKCFRFIYKNLTTFPFGKPILGKLDSLAFGDLFSFKVKVGVNEKLAKT